MHIPHSDLPFSIHYTSLLYITIYRYINTVVGCIDIMIIVMVTIAKH